MGADAPPSEPPATAPKTARKRRCAADPRTQHPAIQACKHVSGHFPSKNVYDSIIKALGESPDVDKLRCCFQEWCLRGHNPENLNWAIDWYVNGIRQQAPRASPADRKQSAIDQRQDMIRRFAQGGTDG